MKLLLLLLLTSCSSNIAIRVTSTNSDDLIVHGKRKCHSPCTIKVKREPSSKCSEPVTISALSTTTYFIRHSQLIACNDTTIYIR